MQMRKVLAIIVLVAAVLPAAGLCKSFKTVSGVPCFEARPGQFYKLNVGGSPPSAFAAHKFMSRFSGKSKGLAAVDLSSSMPPVGDAGNQNSSSAWASTYYYKTFQEAKEHGWSVATTDHQYSPTFTYNQTNFGADNGANLSDAMQLLVDKGATTMAQQPYLATDYMSWPTPAQYLQAMPARAQSCAAIFSGYGKAAAQLQAMKDTLAGGDIFVVSIAVYADFDCTAPNYLYDRPQSSTYVGQLSVAIVGYDDTVGGVGGFKFRNCWGADWGNAGSGYLSYYFMSHYAWEGWTMTDRIGYQPTQWSHIAITHPRRQDLTITLGHGDLVSPDWSNVVYANQGGYGQDVDCYVDVTDYPHVDGSWWLKLADKYSGAAGTLTKFSLIKDTAEMSSTETPLAIPDMSSTVAHLAWALDNFTLQVTTAAGSTPLDSHNYVTADYTRYGVPAQVQLWNGKPATVEADAGLSMQYSDVSSASSDTVRWKLASSTTKGMSRSFVKGRAKAVTVTTTYYQQHHKLFSTLTKAGPALTASNSATLTYKSGGTAATANVYDGMTADAAVWADHGSTWAYSSTSKASTATERWSVYSVPASGGGANPAPPLVVDELPVVEPYWHQYHPLLTFTGADSTHLVAVLQRALCGQQVLGTPRAAKWTDWADDASTLAVSPTTTGTPVRKTLDTTSWTVSSSFSATASYRAYFTIAGAIKNKAGTPVSGVLVHLGDLMFTTKSDGLFQFADLDPGTYTIIPSKVGAAFAPVQTTVTVGVAQGNSLANNFVQTTVPSILTWTPQGTAVAPTDPITLTFSEAMDPVTTGAAFLLQETFPGSPTVGPPIVGTTTWSTSGRLLTFTPAQRLKAYRSYRVIVAATAQSAAGGPLGTDFQWTFQTKDCLAVVANSPTSTTAPCDTPITLEFDRDVSLASVGSQFSIAPAVGGKLTLTTPRQLVFTPSAPLPYTSTYVVTLKSAAAGLDGVKLLKNFSWSFTTQGPTKVVSVTPTGTKATLSTAVVVTFDRPMQRDVTRAAFSLISAAGPVAGASTWDATSQVLTFKPTHWLTAKTVYTVGVSVAAISADGAPLGAPYTSQFTTANALQIATATPNISDAAINSAIHISFDRSVDPSTFSLSLQPVTTGATPVALTTYWTDDSHVTLTPQYLLPSATRFVATIAKTLTAVDGTKLSAPYVWNFATHGLTVVKAHSPVGPGVKPAASIVIRFDRPMDKASVAASLSVFQVTGTQTAVTGSITWNAAGTEMTFAPANRLASYTDYRVVLARTALSADGLMMASGLQWMFQTVACVQITAFGPTGNQVAANSVISLQFDQQMRRGAVEPAFSISPAAPGVFEWVNARTVRYHPTAPLTAGQKYQVRLAASARARDGLGLVSTFAFSFTVKPAAAGTTAPVALTAAQAAGGNIAISFTLASAAEVQVRVMNMAGRPIVALGATGLSSAGANVVLWNGKSASGSRAPAGTYLVQVVTRSAGGSQSSALTPLQIR